MKPSIRKYEKLSGARDAGDLMHFFPFSLQWASSNLRQWAAALLFVFVCISASAQSGGTGALAGTVTDATMAVIPGAAVTLTSNDSGQTRTTVTAGNGTYRFGLLPPGTYSVTFAGKGFGTSAVPKVTINVTETAALDSVLTPGAESTTVTVTSGAQAIETTSSTLGTLVTTKQITAIPLSTRNYTQTLSFSAGVVMDVSNAGSLGNSTNDIYVNGNSNVDNNFQMDGAEVNDVAAGEAGSQGPFGGIPIPNPDAIQEFKIQTTLYDAGYGRNAGGNVNVVTKSGGNVLHGALWEFLRNDALNANDFFLKQTGQRRPELRQNQFGVAIGGPIVKDKLFFFGSYQGTRQINGLSSFGRSTIFLLSLLTNNRTAAALGSTFCHVQNSVVAPPGTQFGTGFYGGQAINCTGSNINPVALNLLNLKNADGTYFVPTPQAVLTGATGPVGVSNFSAPARYNEDQFIVNSDYLLTHKNTLSVRYVQMHAPAKTNFSCVNIGLGGSAPCAPGSPAQEIYDNHVATLKLTSILNSNLVNEARASFVRSGAITPTSDTNTAASVGLPTLNANHPQLPVIIVNGLFQLGGNISDGNGSYNNQYQIADQVSYAHHANSIRAGIEAETAQANDRGYGEERGELNFQSFNDFLLGGNAAANGSPFGFGNIFETVGLAGGAAAEVLNFRLHDINSFVADDITVNPQLTLNVGVRWDINGKVFENSGNLVNVFTSLALAVPTPPATGTYAGYTVANNYKGVLPAGVVRRANNNASASGTPLTNVSPRFGFKRSTICKIHLQFTGRAYNHTLANSYTQQPYCDFNAFRVGDNGLLRGMQTTNAKEPYHYRMTSRTQRKGDSPSKSPRDGFAASGRRKPIKKITAKEVQTAALDVSLGYSLRRAQMSTFAEFSEAMSSYSVRPSHYAVLVLVRTNPGLSQSAVSRVPRHSEGQPGNTPGWAGATRLDGTPQHRGRPPRLGSASHAVGRGICAQDRACSRQDGIFVSRSARRPKITAFA